MNFTISDNSTCPSTSSGTVSCRSTGIFLPYASIGNTKKGVAFISGFVVDSFKTGANTVFGLGLRSMTPGVSSLGVTVYVMGQAFLTSVSVYYVSF